jgi:hypothetical protein
MLPGRRFSTRQIAAVDKSCGGGGDKLLEPSLLLIAK